jgi:predicted ATP-dependent endonuclease of OLD family
MRKKTKKQLEDVFNHFDNPSDFLEYSDSSNSKNNSPGYNSEKYLQEILDNPSSNIIIIDQPEDNLGNKFISDELVNLIRELKFKKQMFLVTHNPAIVVYGDAESIICAQNDDNRISYSQIKLEDVSSQKEICSILDGGEYIFDNRARKYNIQKLLIKEE